VRPHELDLYRTDPEEWVKRQLGFFRKAFDAGNLGALLDAVILSTSAAGPLPPWIAKGLIEIFRTALRQSRDGRKWLRRYRQDLIDSKRMSMVEAAREHGFAWKDAYEEASRQLRGTLSAGSENAVERSYKRFKKNSAENPFRYLQLETIVLARVPPKVQLG
jgi:hypothetical protein